MKLLLLDSKDVEKSEDFTVEFRNPIPVKNAKIALKSMSMWVSWHNIDETNNILKYTFQGTHHQIKFDHGNYTVRDLNNFMIKHLNDDPPIQFGINFATTRIVMKLKPGYSVDFRDTELRKILGFEPKLYTEEEQTGKYIANISRGIDDIHIHCNIIEGALYNDNFSDIIYSFTPHNPPGSLIKVDEINPIYAEVNRSDHIYRIRMYITDQDNNIINLNNQRVVYRLILD